MQGNIFDFKTAVKYFPKLLEHLNVTLLIVISSMVIGSIIGIILVVFRIYKIAILNQLAIIYISFMRGTPIIVQMFLIFYGLPFLLSFFGININRWEKMYFIIITYGLNVAALLAEVFRSSISSIPRGQVEAAYSVGLTSFQAFTRIVVPQAIISALPSMATVLVSLLQDTAIASQLGVIDVMGEINVLGANTKRTIEGYVDAAIIFLVISFVIEFVFSKVEKKLIIKR